jgi:alkanesulfonate monooxygenase SsuD/methylene tetrahydromethanopterin reductase-like flavin-dependent oxidoreductase (luciferase family)
VRRRFAERGAATDEYLMAFRELWTKDKPRFDGRFVKFADILFAPKPVQKPCPALWIGGESGPAMRRAASFGDGWYPIGVNPRHRLDTTARYRAAVERLRKLVIDAGRDPARVALAFRVHRHGPSSPTKADNGERFMFSGSNAEIIDDLRAMSELGVKAIDFNFSDLTVDAMRQVDGAVWPRKAPAPEPTTSKTQREEEKEEDGRYDRSREQSARTTETAVMVSGPQQRKAPARTGWTGWGSS